MIRTAIAAALIVAGATATATTASAQGYYGYGHGPRFHRPPPAVVIAPPRPVYIPPPWRRWHGYPGYYRPRPWHRPRWGW